MRLSRRLLGCVAVWAGLCICVLPDHVSAQQGQNPPQSIMPGMYGQANPPNPQLGQQRSTIEGIKPFLSFDARDSLILTLSDSTRIGTLFGQANANHEKGLLTAGQVSLYLHKDELEATPGADSTVEAIPLLRRPNDQQELQSRRILFNVESGKGKFEAAEIQVQQGTLQGEAIKNISESVVFIEDGRYSTCPPNHMTYYIRANRLKVVDQEEIFFTNARLFVLDIPYPLPIPFGYIPAGPESRRSGLLQPTFVVQNSSRRGLGLQQVGWFQVFNEYLTGQLSGDVYTSGTYFLQGQAQATVTDKFSSNLTLGYSREQGMEPTDPGFAENVSRRISLTYRQTISPYSSVNAAINFASSNYFQRNSYNIDERASTNSNSRLAYQFRDPDNRFNFNTNLAISQRFQDNATSLTGPSASFSLRSFAPFAPEGGQDGRATGGQESTWRDRFIVTYSNTFNSRFSYQPLDSLSSPDSWTQAVFDPATYRENTGEETTPWQVGLRQNVSLSLGQLLPSQFLQLNGSVNLTEVWVPMTVRKSYNPETGSLETTEVPGFAAGHQGSASLSLNTTLYGLADWKIGSLEGFRHTFKPSIAMSISPDFQDESWGMTRTIETPNGPQTYSIFENSIYPVYASGKQWSLAYNIQNTFETKQVKRDSTGEEKTNVLRLIDQLSLTGSYNLALDSLRLSPLSVRLTSRAVPNISLQASASYRFYSVNELGQPTNEWVYRSTGKLLQPTRFRLSASTRIRGGSRGATVESAPYLPYNPSDLSYFNPYEPILEPITPYPLNAPWSVNLSFSYSWIWQNNAPARKTAILNARSIQFQLSDRWNVSTQLGYDFIRKELTPSQFSLNRRMECWNLSMQFNPFGDFTYYFFRLNVDAGQLQNLFQKLPVLNNLERSSSPYGRRF